MMETLKVLRAQEQAEACWKNFKERTLTKKNARENLLLNTDFNSLLQLLLSGEGNERSEKVAIDFVIKCIQSQIISPTALLTLIQQKLPASNSCKLASMPVFSRVSGLILEFEKQIGINFAFQLGSTDLRLVPFLTEKVLSLSSVDANCDFINFLLGDPDLVFTSSIYNDPHYKMSRCRILSHLADNVENEEYSELLTTFLIWNSSRLCVMELGCLTQISQFFARNQNYSAAHSELFEVYVEVLCNELFKFGSFSETIEFICINCSKLISEYSAFKFGSLLLVRKGIDTGLVCAILKLLLKHENLGDFSKTLCAELMIKYQCSDEMENLMREIFNLPLNSKIAAEEILYEPFTEFGMMTKLAYSGSRPQSAVLESYFDLTELSRKLSDFSSLNLGKYVKNGHFESLFSLLAYRWVQNESEEIVKDFLKLLVEVENEDSEAKILRYSWVVDFFETYFNDEMYLNYLPLISDFVTSTDNILFAFVQQKVSLFLSQKDNVSVQVPSMLSLFSLFDSSQSRQSRLNFLTTMTLSYLHNIISQNLNEIDTRAVVLGFKLVCKLSEIAVVDPRDIWTKYSEKLIAIANHSLWTNSHVRGAIFSFASALRIVPDGLEGEVNEIKFSGIKTLLENLVDEMDPFALDQICDSLTKFDAEILRKVEVKLLCPEPTFDQEGNVKEVPIEDILSKSSIFNPSKLYELSKRYDVPSQSYKNLWTKLIDYEVETMPRTKFLGSNEKSSSVPEARTKFISNPSFCNGLLFETFVETEFSSTEHVLKCVKSRLMPLVPSINSLMWYVRPYLPSILLEAVDKIMKQIDDQRVKKQLSEYEYLLVNLKTGTTPQNTSTLLMVISAIMKSLFMNQNISENFLYSNWIAVLTKKLSEITEFKALLGNEEFLASLAISCNILSGCSLNIDTALFGLLDTMILNSPKVRDGVAVYCSIEAGSKLNFERIEIILNDKSASSKRRLISGLAALRMGRCFNEKLMLPDKPDDISLLLEIIFTKEGRSQNCKTTFSDPLEFKGLISYVQSLISPEELREKSKQRAFDNGSVPAALKYDAIFAHLLGSGMSLTALAFENSDIIDLNSIQNSTKDSKCLALLQMISRSSSTDNEIGSSNSGLERFDKFSWLKFIGSMKSNFKYEILSYCKLLPRIAWSPVPISNFDLVLKHVLSITPITKVPYINPSLLSCFLENAFEVTKTDSKHLKRVIEILHNNSDERSSKILCQLINYGVDGGDESSLSVIIEESLKFPHNLLSAFEVNRLNSLKPEILSEMSSLLSSFLHRFSLDSSKLAIIDLNAKDNVFNVLKNVLNSSDVALRDLRLNVLGIKIKTFGGKDKIKSAIEIIDLMFIYQQDEDNFLILSKLLCDIFENISSILLDSKAFLNDSEIVNKIRSRAVVIPKDIYDRLEASFISFEFEKDAF